MGGGGVPPQHSSSLRGVRGQAASPLSKGLIQKRTFSSFIFKSLCPSINKSEPRYNINTCGILHLLHVPLRSLGYFIILYSVPQRLQSVCDGDGPTPGPTPTTNYFQGRTSDRRKLPTHRPQRSDQMDISCTHMLMRVCVLLPGRLEIPQIALQRVASPSRRNSEYKRLTWFKSRLDEMVGILFICSLMLDVWRKQLKLGLPLVCEV